MNSIDKFIDFFLHEKGVPVTVDSIPIKALVSDAPRGADYYFDDKYIRAKALLHSGAIVLHREENWLVISQVDQNENSSQCKMRKSNHITKFTIDDWLYEFVSVLEMINLTVSRGGTINMATGKLRVSLPANKLTHQIGINTRFIASFSPWKVIGVDVTKTGLVILESEKDLIGADDDMENEIANKNSIPVWTVSAGTESTVIKIGETPTLSPSLYKNSVEVLGEAFLWQSEDKAIATVDGGVITAVAIGTTTVILRWVKHPSVLTEIAVSVEAEPVEVITYKFYTENTDGTNKSYTQFDVRQVYTKVFGIEKYINGVLAQINDTYTFSFNPNGATSSNYIYKVISDYSVSVENKMRYTEPVTLTGTSNQTNEVLSISFYLKALF